MVTQLTPKESCNGSSWTEVADIIIQDNNFQGYTTALCVGNPEHLLEWNGTTWTAVTAK